MNIVVSISNEYVDTTKTDVILSDIEQILNKWERQRIETITTSD